MPKAVKKKSKMVRFVWVGAAFYRGKGVKSVERHRGGVAMLGNFREKEDRGKAGEAQQLCRRVTASTTDKNKRGLD